MDINQFIQQSMNGNVAQARETLDTALSSRAFEALDTKKQEIAKTLYGEGEDTEVQNTDDLEIEDEDLLTQEEYEQLSELLMSEDIDPSKVNMKHIQLKKAPGTKGTVSHVHYKGQKIGSIKKEIPTGMVRDLRTGEKRRATLRGHPGEFATQYRSSDGHSWDKIHHAVQSVRDDHSDNLVAKRNAERKNK